MFSPQSGLNIERNKLSAKADEAEKMVKRLKAMSRALRHAAACPAPSHAECPTFQRLLRSAASGAFDGARKRRELPRH
jgi:hypothetical protein